ncbi:Cytochrome b561 and DOMON domain-containing protein [Striga hermonthica]|uniref:Cytochrome b561 and DOMON domain-containing protein n=1 Tax=Striga hermonthica TaxID=68872 RepID=A0A9N7RD57_STRHE|nr:Cytochrome b561 and DOMON domain-containing protein [Striga hermonthica]
MHTLFLFLIFMSTHPNRVDPAHCPTTSSSRTYNKCSPLPSQGASFAWSYHPHNSTLDLAFFGSFISPSGWVGFGLNPNSPEMSGSRVLISFPDPNSGQLVLLPYILDPPVKLQRGPLLSRPLPDLHLLSSFATLYGGRMATVHSGAAIEIRASLKLVPNRTKIYLVWNRGLYVQGYSPAMHPTSPDDLSSATTLNLLTASEGGAHASPPPPLLKYAHGITNSISWGLLLPTGAVLARYLRPVRAVGPAWFYLHAGVQLIGVFVGTVGFGLGIRLGQIRSGQAYGLHRKLGFAVFCLGWLQTMALLFRPKTTHRFRRYWKSYHHFVGYACVVLGVVNCFQGLEALGESWWSSYAKLGYSLCLSSLVGVCIALEVNSWVVFCRKAKEEKIKREGLFGLDEKESVGGSIGTIGG